MEKRDVLISFLQTFGILLVVVGHSCYGASTPPLWHTWIYSFHMPLFMFISGYLLKYGCEKKHTRLADITIGGRNGFLMRKVERLLIPYVVISSLAFVPKALLSQFAMRPVDISFNTYCRMLIYPWDNVIVFFWFLPTLFLIFLIVIVGAHCLKSVRSSVWHCGIFIALLLLHLFNPFLGGATILNVSGVIDYLFYFALGYYCCRLHIFSKISFGIGVQLIFSFVVSILLVLVVPDFRGKDLISAINGIYLSVMCGKWYCKQRWHFLHFLFGASYAIYLFSWFPQVASQQIFLSLTHAPWWVGSILSVVTGVFIPWLIYKWIIKHREGNLGRCIAYLTGH